MLTPSPFFRLELESGKRVDKFPRTDAKTKEPWNKISRYCEENLDVDIPSLIGIYILWFKSKQGWVKPIYIGKTVKQTLRKESLSIRNCKIFNEYLEDHLLDQYESGGKFYLSFLYNKSPKYRKGNLIKADETEIESCETDFIHYASMVNEKLLNKSQGRKLEYTIDQHPATGGWNGGKDPAIMGPAKALSEGLGIPWTHSKSGTRLLIDKWPVSPYSPRENVLKKYRTSLFVDW